MPALVACDVDGTLLDDGETVTKRTRDAVHAAVDAGTHFILATGRPPRWVRPIVDALGFAPMAVCANGGAHPARRRPGNVGRSCDPRHTGCGTGGRADRRARTRHGDPQFVSSPGYEHAWLNPDNTEVSIDHLLSAPAIKLLIRKAGAASADMAAELAKHVGFEGDITYSTNNGLVEIVPLGISKATGVDEIARPLGISDAEVVAFGDMPNDVPMLLRAGLGVAMGNAHPDALAVADEVTAPNSEDGVARVLERWWS